MQEKKKITNMGKKLNKCFIICSIFSIYSYTLDLEVRVRELENTQDHEQEVILDDHEHEASHVRAAKVSVDLDRVQFLDRKRGLDLIHV